MSAYVSVGGPGRRYETRVRKAALKRALLGEDTEPIAFGNYHLLEVLGKGASGVVFRAEDRRLQRTVALKLLPGAATGPGRSGMAEARSLARVSHPNVVGVYEAGEHDGCAFLAMEFVQGQSLRAWMRASHDGHARLDAFRQAVVGMAALHDARIVHGDFKPENALVGSDGRVRLVDFGLSGDPQASDAERFAGLGTRGYMAPELSAGGAPTAHSDQYALCKTGLELLGHDDATAGSRATFPRDVLLRGLAAAPGERHADLRALQAKLQPSTRRHVAWALGLGVFAAAAVGAGALLLWPEAEVVDCGGPLLSIEQSKDVLQDLVRHKPGLSAADVADPERYARVTLMLGRWEDGCRFLDERLALEVEPELVCLRAVFCKDRSALPERARCFGGELEACRRLAIVHEYEYQEALKFMEGDAEDSRALFHRAMMTEAMSEGCALGSEIMCSAVENIAGMRGPS